MKSRAYCLYCGFTVRKASGVASVLQKLLMDRYVFLRLVLGTVRNGHVLGTSASPSLGKGELSAVQGDLTRKECSGTWNKGGFLLKETQSVSESSFIILNDLGLDGYPEQFCSLTSIYLISETVCGIIPCSNIKKKKKACVIINQSYASFRSPFITAVLPRRRTLSIRDCQEWTVGQPDRRLWGTVQTPEHEVRCDRRSNYIPVTSHTYGGLQCAHLRPCWVTSL